MRCSGGVGEGLSGSQVKGPGQEMLGGSTKSDQKAEGQAPGMREPTWACKGLGGAAGCTGPGSPASLF